jgi:tetratricopeptide (TPR) repeat protein
MTRIQSAIATVLLLALAWLAYHPGLQGGFLFDDFVNLDAIGATGPVDDPATLARYLTSGTADPTGRPLALLSFLVDARDWPAAAAPFLRTNLLLHLCNGVLLLLLLRRLGEILLPGQATRSRAAALLGAGLWLLHPLLVSTTLYIVQRESMLAATFCIAGLLGHVLARERYARRPGVAALCCMGLSILGGTALAVLCKANGALLPLFALVLEWAVLQRLGDDSRLRRLRWGVLVLPTLLLLLYLAGALPSLFRPLPERGWSIAERLLTEPRVIASYLGLLLAPRVFSSGLYNDGFGISSSLLHPWTTLPALLLLCGLVVLAWWVRGRSPALALALGFFLAGHLLESTVIPLELYFEHRNYLPSMLLFWPLALAVAGLRISARARVAIGVAALLLLAFLTWQRARVWSQPELLAKTWAMQNPRSSRAQATAAMLDTSAGRPQQAVARLLPLWQARPADLQLGLNYVNAACNAGGITSADAEAVGRAIASARAADGVRLAHGWLSNAIDLAAAGSCAGLDLAVVTGWVDAMSRNPAFDSEGDRNQEIEPLRAKIALYRGDADAALAHFDRALAAFVTPDVAARQTAMLASQGAYEQALAHLDHSSRLAPRAAAPRRGMPWLHAKVLEWQGYWPNEMAILRRKLHEEIAAKKAGP